jgi:hypothetical protein
LPIDEYAAFQAANTSSICNGALELSEPILFLFDVIDPLPCRRTVTGIVLRDTKRISRLLEAVEVEQCHAEHDLHV